MYNDWNTWHGKEISAQKLNGNRWETLGNNLGSELHWNKPARRYDGLVNYKHKKWATSPLANKRNWNYSIVPKMKHNYQWDL